MRPHGRINKFSTSRQREVLTASYPFKDRVSQKQKTLLHAICLLVNSICPPFVGFFTTEKNYANARNNRWPIDNHIERTTS